MVSMYSNTQNGKSDKWSTAKTINSPYICVVKSRPYKWIVLSKDNTPGDLRGINSGLNCKELPNQCLDRK